jgi:membrane-associated protease RseP (regulator of RpoE activity)
VYFNSRAWRRFSLEETPGFDIAVRPRALLVVGTRLTVRPISGKARLNAWTQLKGISHGGSAMRKFFVILAALVAASAAVTAGTLQSSSRGAEQRADAFPGDFDEWVSDALELVDGQAPDIRKLAIMPGRGVELGVTIRDLDSEQAKTASGAVVEDVRAGSAAEKAGIHKGDVIVEFDGERVRGQRHLSRLVSETPEGRTVRTAVMRDGKRIDLSVTPATAERAVESDFEFFVPGPDHMPGMPGEGRRFFFSEPHVQSFKRGEGFFMSGRARLGVSIESLTPQLAEYFGTKSGALVTTVQPDSPAAKAGLKAGDVITSVNGTEVKDSRGLTDAVRSASDGASLSLGYVRDKKAGTATATLEKSERRVVQPSERPI